MFMGQADCMAELVQHHAFIQPAEIHRRPADLNAFGIRADIRPGAVIGERNADVRIGCIIEFKIQVGVIRPLGRKLFDNVLLLGGTLQNRMESVDPFGQSLPIGEMARVRPPVSMALKGIARRKSRGKILS